MNELIQVSRFEIIDHTENGEGRVFVKYGQNMKVQTSIQDEDKTLKIFISDEPKDLEYNTNIARMLYAYNILRECRTEKPNKELEAIIKKLGAML